ncbi:SDR family oxidoreductase [Nakamurella sp. YIM 132087]|uniref:SDR family oxidoreductase n=1 Tax=Nakamurella alba TaxID=2665158 RepID=A0A7K1FSX0_9ACTN|nr:SDR family NAD(P)-dependent oxidoreductase [Nakamurella alba]MTD17255.1 SDR family oxidoreductase [Nakamurella alba]
MTGTLDGKVALITGAGRGIGRAIAEKLGGSGARLLLNDLDAGVLEETRDALRAGGIRAESLAGDVTAPDMGDRLVGTAVDTLGGLDIIVNNAGYTWDGIIGKMSDEQFDAMLDIHLKAPFRILRAAAPWFREQAKLETQSGHEVFRKVVNISSAVGIGGNAGQVNYAAAKAGINGVTATLAKEWGRYRVNVNSVAFGLIRTRLTAPVDTPDADSSLQVGERSIAKAVRTEHIEAIERTISLGRGATPEEAAGAVYLMCLPESDYITGHVLLCTGGIPL